MTGSVPQVFSAIQECMMMFRCSSVCLFVLFLTTAAIAQPGPARPVAPASDVVGSTIAFTWQSATGATWYHFWLGKPDASLMLQQWYTAAHAGCTEGGGCTITISPPVSAGVFVWYVRTWSPAGYGPWSVVQTFTVRGATQAWSTMLPPSRRFTLVFNGQGVLDNETGLVWQRQPANVSVTFVGATSHCAGAQIGGRLGWRLPTVAELASLIDPTGGLPTLPPGHPFTLPSNPFFWSQTIVPTSTTVGYGVGFDQGSVSQAQLQDSWRVWCVRGGSTAG